MKEFPDEAILQTFVGRRVSNVTFQPFSIDIRFDDDSYLVVEHVLEHAADGGISEVLEPKKQYGATTLHKIVEALVISSRREPFSWALAFDNGHSIKIQSIPGPRESGHIWKGSDLFVF